MELRKSPLGRCAVVLSVLGLGLLPALTACTAVEENPLGVNAVRSVPQASSAPSTDAGADGEVAPVGMNLGEDPLNVGIDGATLCGVQPRDSRLRYTVMLHNPTLETFTLGEMALGNPKDLTILSSMVQTANREGHHHGGPDLEEHDAHSASPTPTAPPEPIGPPVPADGYQFVPDAHINIIVTVELAEGASRGTADNILVDFSSSARDYEVAHDLGITVDATSCS